MQRKAVILTALQKEYLAVRAHLTDIKPARHEAGNIYEKGTFKQDGESGCCLWEVGIAEIGPENETAALEAERAIAFFQPEIVLFVGIAGGFKVKDAGLGDVVVATEVYGYESGKVEADGMKARPKVFRPDHDLLELVKYLCRQENWMARIVGGVPEKKPQLIRGPIAAGNKVIHSKKSEIGQYII